MTPLAARQLFDPRVPAPGVASVLVRANVPEWEMEDTGAPRRRNDTGLSEWRPHGQEWYSPRPPRRLFLRTCCLCAPTCRRAAPSPPSRHRPSAPCALQKHISLIKSIK